MKALTLNCRVRILESPVNGCVGRIGVLVEVMQSGYAVELPDGFDARQMRWVQVSTVVFADDVEPYELPVFSV